VRVHREVRAQDDGYSNPLAPGLHASDDAARLAQEIAFASGRLLGLHASPPGLFNEIQTLASEGELERATWMCFMTVYLSPLQGDDPFASIRLALARAGGAWDAPDAATTTTATTATTSTDVAVTTASSSSSSSSTTTTTTSTTTTSNTSTTSDVPLLDGIPLGPRTSHDPERGDETLRAYRHWARQAGGQARALIGEESWTPRRRFERAFERLALPGFGRMGRYELLVTLGRLGLYDMQADSLHLTGGRGTGADDLTVLAAKRVLAVGDPVYLERRAVAFAQELAVGIDVLDLALANWGAGERATLGFSPDTLDPRALERARAALGL
jgi:Alpha-glutamyl/putrescinyl thymine pyrophosphorylase clade 3